MDEWYEKQEKEPKTLEEMKKNMRVLEFNRYLEEANKMNFRDERRSEFVEELEERLKHDEESVERSSDFIIESYKQVENGLEFVKKVQNNKLTKFLFRKELLGLEKQIRPKELIESGNTDSRKTTSDDRDDYLKTIKVKIEQGKEVPNNRLNVSDRKIDER